MQEVTTRLPNRIGAAGKAFASTADLASALRRAGAAHAEHHKACVTDFALAPPPRVRGRGNVATANGSPVSGS